MRHLILDGFAVSERFRRPPRAVEPPEVPAQNHRRHGTELLGQLRGLRPRFSEIRRIREREHVDGVVGLNIEFEGFPNIELAFESLSRERSGIELLNLREDAGRFFATVFVPDGKLHVLENLIRTYANPVRNTEEGPRNRRLIDTIRQIRAASLRELWTDDPAAFPTDPNESLWWEIWLPRGRHREVTAESFRRLAETQGFRTARGELLFPERTVVLAHSSAAAMTQSLLVLNSVAELRRAKETADFFDSMSVTEQTQWLAELQQRCRFQGVPERAPYVCILDTGVNVSL